MTTMVDREARIEALAPGQAVDRYGDSPVWSTSDGLECISQYGRDHDPERPHYGAAIACSRRPHPQGTRHIGLGGTSVMGFWYSTGTSEAPTEAKEEVKEVDDSAAPVVVDPQPGELYRFRNRPTILQVVGHRQRPASTGDVEVLDLTAQRFRVIWAKQLVPLRPQDVPDEAGVKWAANYMAARRADARKVALKESRSFTPTDLKAMMDRLDMEGKAPRSNMRINMELRIAVPAGLTGSDVTKVFTEMLLDMEAPDGWVVRQQPSVETRT